MVKWEYLTVLMANDATQLNKLGADGWELVACIPQPLDSLFCVFKRPVIDDGKATVGATRKRAG